MNLRWRCAQFFELYWWKRYLNHQDKTAYLHWKKNYWSGFLQKSGIILPQGANVLDAGCGPAGIFTILDEFRVDAVDPLIDRYCSTLPHFHPADYPHVRFFSQPLESFCQHKKYEVVFCLNAINHMAELNNSLDRLVSLVMPGGYLLLSVDAHNFNSVKRLLQFIPADILHPHQFSVPDYTKMLCERGLQIERTILIKKSRIFSYYLFVTRAAPYSGHPVSRASRSW